MRLILVTNDGTVVPIVDDLEDYDFSKSLARQSIMADIESAIAEADDR